MVTVHKKTKEPPMDADKRRYLNSDFASAFISVPRRFLYYHDAIAWGSVAARWLVNGYRECYFTILG